MDSRTLSSLANIYGEIEKEDWHGFECLLFKKNGHVVGRLALPQQEAEGRPWIWRTLFWNAWPAFDLEMLKRGWHVGFIEHIGYYGCLERTGHFDAFYYAMTERAGLSGMPCLEGFSRGGLTAFNWAAANPTKVLCVYGDNPVCDVRSWPGGKGSGKGSPDCWAECLRVLGLSEEESKGYKGSPIFRAETLAKFSIPVIIVNGDSDTVVPYEENAKILAERMKAAGGRCEVILKKGQDHHPHSLENPEPLVNFVTKCWTGA